jgi:hypothetical protein
MSAMDLGTGLILYLPLRVLYVNIFVRSCSPVQGVQVGPTFNTSANPAELRTLVDTGNRDSPNPESLVSASRPPQGAVPREIIGGAHGYMPGNTGKMTGGVWSAIKAAAPALGQQHENAQHTAEPSSTRAPSPQRTIGTPPSSRPLPRPPSSVDARGKH